MHADMLTSNTKAQWRWNSHLCWTKLLQWRIIRTTACVFTDVYKRLAMDSFFVANSTKAAEFCRLVPPMVWLGMILGPLIQLNIRALNCKPVSTRRGQFCYSQRNALQICDLHSDVNNVLLKVHLSHSCHCERQSEGVFMCAMRTVSLS